MRVFRGLFECAGGAARGDPFFVRLLVRDLWGEEVLHALSLFSERGGRAVDLETVGFVTVGRLSFHWSNFGSVTALDTLCQHL